MKRILFILGCANIVVSGCGARFPSRSDFSPMKDAGCVDRLLASPDEIEAAVCAWAEHNSNASDSLDLYTADWTYSAHICPLEKFNGRAVVRGKTQGANMPELRYRNAYGTCWRVKGPTEPFSALSLDGDFEVSFSSSNECLQYFSWNCGCFRGADFVTNLVANSPSLRYLDVSLCPSPAGDCMNGGTLNTLTNCVVDLSCFSSLKSLGYVRMSLPVWVSNTDTLLGMETSPDVRVWASVEDTTGLREFLSAGGWLRDAEAGEVVRTRNSYVNNDPACYIKTNVVNGAEELYVSGLHDFSGSAKSTSVHGLVISCESVEPMLFQKMFDDLLSVMPNVTWVVVSTRFTKKSVLDINSLFSCRDLAMVSVKVENGVVLGMESCKSLSRLVSCEVDFSLNASCAKDSL